MKQLGDAAALVFIVFIIILATTSILAVWEVLEADVIIKSIATVGVLTFATAILLAYSHYSEDSTGGDQSGTAFPTGGGLN